MGVAEVVARLEALLPRLERLVDDHEARIRALERRSLRLAGALALAVFVIPIAITLILR